MKVIIDNKSMKVEVSRNNKILKSKDLTREEYSSLMVECSGDMIDSVRLANKLFKGKRFTFTGLDK
jgi:hypothetical protein